MPTDIKANDARQGVKVNRLRWVLAGSMTLAVLALAVVALNVI